MAKIPEIDVEQTSTSVLMAFFNTHSGRPPVKKFTTRGDAIRRVRALIRESNFDGPPTVPSALPSAEEILKENEEMAKKNPKRVAGKDGKLRVPRGSKAAKKPKEDRVPLTATERSAAVAKSWKDPAVAARRAAHHHVIASGKEYGSTRKAWKALGLEPGKCRLFRRELKIKGELDFEYVDGDGKKRSVKFRIVPRVPAEPKSKKPKKVAAKKTAAPRKPRKAKAPPTEPQTADEAIAAS